MYILPFPLHERTDPTPALLQALLDLVLSDEADGVADEVEEEWEDDNGAMFLDPQDDAHGNEITSGSTSSGWEVCSTDLLPAALERWTDDLIRQVPQSRLTGAVVAAVRRTQVHYHLGVDILGTCDWRAAYPLLFQGRAGWLIIEWDAGDEDVPPHLPHSGSGYLLFGASAEAVRAQLRRRLVAHIPSLHS